jgi:flagellar M-ring protein FliF
MDLIKNIPDKWKNQSYTNKSIILVIAGCLILSSFFFYRWATGVEYAALFTNMQTDNAGKIVEGLKSMKIPYQLTDGGKTVMVPKDQVYEVRLNLATKGLASEGGLGFELFDKSNLGATDFERNINYQRALQEELRRTIVRIDAVSQARVHLVLPEKSAFIDNQRKAQASIVLELKPMVKLQPAQVKGIAELIAGSVGNLSVEDVNIVDSAGRILSGGINNSETSGLQLTQLELKRNFEKSLEDRIQQLLENIYGSNKIAAMITANLDFNQKEANRVVWGKEGVIASEQLIQSNTNITNNPVAVGDPNRVTPPVNDSEVNTAGVDISSIKNYEINRVEEKEIFAPGRVLSISTAIAINGELLPAAEMRIKDIVGAAIGFDVNRGDTINVLSTKFDQSGLEEAKAEMAIVDAEEKKHELIDKWMNWGFKGVGVLVFFILCLLLIRALKTRSERSEHIIQQPTSVKNFEEQLEQLERKNNYMSEDEKIRKILQNQPEVAAQIINVWLDENGSEISG